MTCDDVVIVMTCAKAATNYGRFNFSFDAKPFQAFRVKQII
jgi:hypothetical protein